MTKMKEVSLSVSESDETDSSLVFTDEHDPSIDKDGSFAYASTIAFSQSIYLRSIPNGNFLEAVANIEKILIHEQIHLALYALFDDPSISCQFDNLFPCLKDFDECGLIRSQTRSMDVLKHEDVCPKKRIRKAV